MERRKLRNVIILQFALLMAMGLAVPGICGAAGDDCPPPSVSPPDDPAADDPGSGDEPPADDDTGPTGTEEGSSNDGLFGSLGGEGPSQLTMGILFVVGVIVVAVYLIMVGRMDEDEEEYE